MNVVSERTGEKAVISVQQRFPLTLPGSKKLPTVRRASTVQPMHPQTNNSFVEAAKRKSMNDSMVPPALYESPRRDMLKFASWAEDAIKNQQKDIDRIGSAVDRIERQMTSFKEFMQEVRTELAANRQSQQDIKQKDLTLIQKDMNKLRRESRQFQEGLKEEELTNFRVQLEQMRQKLDSKEQWTEFPTSDAFENLTEDVFKINNNVKQIEGLKMDLQQLQNRLKDMNKFENIASDIVEIKQRVNEVGGLRMEFQQLQNRLKDREVRRRESFRNTDVDVPRTHSRVPKATRRGVSRGQSPQRKAPISLMEVDPPLQDLMADPTEDSLRRTTLRSQIEIVIGESVRGSRTEKWVYTGSSHGQSLRAAFRAFGIEYPKLKQPETIKILEDYVNHSGIQRSSLALNYGEVTYRGESQEPEDPLDPEPEPYALPKRKGDQVENVDEQSRYGSRPERKEDQITPRTMKSQQSSRGPRDPQIFVLEPQSQSQTRP